MVSKPVPSELRRSSNRSNCLVFINFEIKMIKFVILSLVFAVVAGNLELFDSII